MRVSVEKIEKGNLEQVIIQCYKETNEVVNIVNFIKFIDCSLAGYIGDRVTQIFLQDIFYVEAVDNRIFAYTKNKTYELKCKLYEFENTYGLQRFFRCAKSMVVNLMKVDSVYPIFNGRLAAKLFNGEEIIISRQYVPALKEYLKGDGV